MATQPTEQSSPDAETLIALTSDIVAAHVNNNSVGVEDVPELIRKVHEALSGLGTPAEEPRPEPAVSIRASVKKDHIVCLEDGKSMKMLKRHLMTEHGMTPAEYRARWNLPADYPMVAPDYADTRRDLAKKIGLGRKPGQKAVAKSAGENNTPAAGETDTSDKQAPAKKASPKKPAAKKTSAKKASPKKATAKPNETTSDKPAASNSGAKKAPAKKAAAKKGSSPKSTEPKSAAKKAPAKKAPAKKAPTKKKVAEKTGSKKAATTENTTAPAPSDGTSTS